MLKAIFFDLDGTLLDTSIDLGNALNVVMEEYGKAPLPYIKTRAAVSHGANALIKLGFGELSSEQHQKLRNQLLQAYLNNIANNTIAFDGIEELIKQLASANLLWGIVTNKPEPYTTALMPYFKFASQPAATICPEHVNITKPDPEGLMLACKQTCIIPEQAIYIGDHERDIMAGRNAGMKTIAAGYGFTDTTECHKHWQADYNVQTAREIWPIIQTLIQPPQT